MCAEVVLGEGDGEGRVGGEVEGCISLAPVSVECVVVSKETLLYQDKTYLMTAIFTGAKVLARYTCLSAIVVVADEALEKIMI